MYSIVGLSGYILSRLHAMKTFFFSLEIVFFSHYNYNRLHILPLGCSVVGDLYGVGHEYLIIYTPP